MKVLFLTANTPQNRGLAHQVAQEHELCAIVYENRFESGQRLKGFLKKSGYNPFKLALKLWQKYRMRPTDNAVASYIENNFAAYPEFPPAEVLETPNVNDPATKELIQKHKPDVILVSGTRIVRKPIIDLRPKYGIINMHTGLSPYYNGGPSCTFWCLYNEEIEALGATTMFIDEGIDSGNIIFTDRVIPKTDDSHASLEYKAIELGNQLMLKSLKRVEQDPDFKGVPQHEVTTEGKLYYTRDFTFARRYDLQKRLSKGLIQRLVKALPEKPVDHLKTFPPHE